MVSLLTYANLAKVGQALGVSRNAVSNWSRGQDVTPYRLQQVRNLLRPPEPQSATEAMLRRMLAGVLALEAKVDVSPGELAQATTAAETFERLAVEADRRVARRLGASQRTPGEQGGGRAGGPAVGSPSSKRQSS